MSARLKRNTFRVAGAEKQRLLRALVSRREDADLLDRLISSARVHRSAKDHLFRKRRFAETTLPAPRDAQSEPEQMPVAAPAISPTQPPDASQAEPEPAGAFDPYGLPLVPTFQRGGAGALADRLNEVATVDHLRRMARAQQIALPADIRRGDVAPEAVRAAIVKAVEKRIADRRAAAG
jgi:hypothetical protein